MNIRLSLWSINRCEVPGRGPCYTQRVTISDSSIRFLCWCVRQVFLHTLIAELQNTTCILLMVVSSGAIVRRVSFGLTRGCRQTFTTPRTNRASILDDLLNEACTKDVCDIFTKVSHHSNISVVLITQILYHQGRYCRDISLSAMYIVVLKNLRDKNQFYHLARRVYPEDSDGLFQAYLNAIETPHGYLLLDLFHDADSLRFRTCISPDEAPPVIYADIGDETHKGELPHFTYCHHIER